MLLLRILWIYSRYTGQRGGHVPSRLWSTRAHRDKSLDKTTQLRFTHARSHGINPSYRIKLFCAGSVDGGTSHNNTLDSRIATLTPPVVIRCGTGAQLVESYCTREYWPRVPLRATLRHAKVSIKDGRDDTRATYSTRIIQYLNLVVVVVVLLHTGLL